MQLLQPPGDHTVSLADKLSDQSTSQPAFTNQLAFTDQLIDYLLHLADDALILGHRNSEWCGHGPVLELDIAISNIALDLVGQARNFYQYASELINAPAAATGSCHGMTSTGAITPVTEDTLAYFRNAPDFKNCLLAEQPKGDWGVTILRQFLFSTYQYYLYQQLQHSSNRQIAAIAAKALKEVTYHVRWSSEWVIRLGAGTEESHKRMAAALSILQPYTAELFIAADYEKTAAAEGYGCGLAALQPLWQQKVNAVLKDATLETIQPIDGTNTLLFGKEGTHTSYLQEILAEMQLLQRTHPGAEW